MTREANALGEAEVNSVEGNEGAAPVCGESLPGTLCTASSEAASEGEEPFVDQLAFAAVFPRRCFFEPHAAQHVHLEDTDGVAYSGELHGGWARGTGKLVTNENITYEGSIFRGKSLSGTGIIRWENGAVYEGEIKDGLRSGLGTFKHGPVSCTGTWISGSLSGTAEISTDQGTYSGEIQDRIPHGAGTARYASGDIYAGGWLHGRRHGSGTYYWKADGVVYRGEWREGVQDGHGELVYLPPAVEKNPYERLHGERQGTGSFFYADGGLYTGDWEGNQKHGQGVYIAADGEQYEGRFNRDHRVDYKPSEELMEVEEVADERVNFATSRASAPAEHLRLLQRVFALDLDRFLESHKAKNFPNIDCGQFYASERARAQDKQNLARTIRRLREPLYALYRNAASATAIPHIFEERLLDKSSVLAFSSHVLRLRGLWKFLQDAEILTPSLPLADIDEIVDRSLRTEERASDPHHPDAPVPFSSFLTVLVYLAKHRYPLVRHVSEQLSALVKNRLMDNVESCAKDRPDPFTGLADDEIAEASEMQLPSIAKCFSQICCTATSQEGALPRIRDIAAFFQGHKKLQHSIPAASVVRLAAAILYAVDMSTVESFEVLSEIAANRCLMAEFARLVVALALQHGAKVYELTLREKDEVRRRSVETESSAPRAPDERNGDELESGTTAQLQNERVEGPERALLDSQLVSTLQNDETLEQNGEEREDLSSPAEAEESTPEPSEADHSAQAAHEFNCMDLSQKLSLVLSRLLHTDDKGSGSNSLPREPEDL